MVWPLPSPEDLKKKIILKGYKCQTHAPNEEMDGSLTNTYIDRVLVSDAGSDWEKKDLFFRGSFLVCRSGANVKLKSDETIPLQHSSIFQTKLEDSRIANHDECIVITTKAGEQFKIATETDLTKLWSTLVCWKHEMQVSQRIYLSLFNYSSCFFREAERVHH